MKGNVVASDFDCRWGRHVHDSVAQEDGLSRTPRMDKKTFRCNQWLCIIAAVGAPGVLACTLNIVYSDVAAPPYLVGDGEAIPEAPGIAVELVNEAAQRMDCKVNWKRLPNRRVQAEMEAGRADAMLMFSFNPERALYAAYPMKDGKPDSSFRLTALSYAIYVRADSQVKWNGSQFSPLPLTVGVNAGYSVASDLQKMGLTVSEVRSTEQNFAKLQMGRIAAYVMQDFPADMVIEEKRLADVRKIPLPFSSKDYYLPFSQRFFHAAPDVSLSLWDQIAKTKKGRHKELLKKYGDTP